MKKIHATVWLGVALVVVGVARLLVPYSATIGTVHTSCGNAVAYLDGQDNSPNFTSTLSICEKSLQTASAEGAIVGVVGILLLILGLFLLRRKGRLRFARRQKVRRAPKISAQSARATAEWERRADAPRNAQAPQGDVPSGVGPINKGPMNQDVYEQVMRIGRLTRPRTVLSFFGVVFAALVAGSVVAISLFAKNAQLTQYIPWILVFDALVAIVLIIGVFVTITKDPARLMLSEITNQNAVALQRGRRQTDPPEPVVVRRIVDGEERREGVQYGRRWDDSKP